MSHQLQPPVLQIGGCGSPNMIDNFFVFNDPQVLERDRRCNRVSGIGIAVCEYGIGNGGGDFRADDAGANRNVT